MTPATASWSDAALVAGQSFTDPQSGVSIAPVSVGSGGASVNVTFGAGSCNAFGAEGGAYADRNGVDRERQHDSTMRFRSRTRTGCGCGSTPYDVSAVVPTGWASTNARTASIAPGSTASAALA